MRKYELVVLIDGRSNESEIKDSLKSIEKTFEGGILDRDDIGMTSMAYGLHGKKDHDKMYVVSYHLELEPAKLKEIRSAITYIKGLARYFFFLLDNDSPFFKFKELQKSLDEIVTSISNTKEKRKNDFLNRVKNAQYINWKSLPLLNKYVSRFDDIKPRKYNKHPVKMQKRLRTAVIRARELGFLNYVR